MRTLTPSRSAKGAPGGALAVKGFLTGICWTATQPVTVLAHWNAAEKMLEAKLPPKFVGGGKSKPATGRRKSKPESSLGVARPNAPE
jgi:hypothetical protein